MSASLVTVSHRSHHPVHPVARRPLSNPGDGQARQPGTASSAWPSRSSPRVRLARRRQCGNPRSFGHRVIVFILIAMIGGAVGLYAAQDRADDADAGTRRHHAFAGRFRRLAIGFASYISTPSTAASHAEHVIHRRRDLRRHSDRRSHDTGSVVAFGNCRPHDESRAAARAPLDQSRGPDRRHHLRQCSSTPKRSRAACSR